MDDDIEGEHQRYDDTDQAAECARDGKERTLDKAGERTFDIAERTRNTRRNFVGIVRLVFDK